jgi:ATP-dependent protease ClpP protease subunit
MNFNGLKVIDIRYTVKMKVSHVYIYDQIGGWGVTLDSVKSQVDKSSDSIAIHIISGGGEVFEGYAIYNFLKGINKPKTVYIEGLCASIATVIAMAGDTIIMSPMAQFMIHNPLVGVEGDAEQLRKYADQLDKIKGQLIQAYQTKVQLSADELWNMLSNETWLTAEEAKNYGFVTEVKQVMHPVAKVDLKQLNKKEKMDNNLINTIASKLEKVLNKLGVVFKNMDASLEDGTPIYIEAEGEDLVGASVYLVAEGNNVPLEDGSYTLSNGDTMVVSGGVISEYTKVDSQPVDPNANADTVADVEALKAENEALKAELEALKAELEASNNKNATNEAELEAVKADVVALSKDLAKIKNLASPDVATKVVPVNEEPKKSPFDNLAKAINQNRK